MSQLKRCPFCGGEAEFYRTPVKSNGGWCDSVVVRCKECEARTNRILYDARKHQNDSEYDEAVAAWNNRKPVEDVLERLEKEKDALFSARKAMSLEMYNDFEALEKSKMLLEKELTLCKAIENIKEGLN